MASEQLYPQWVEAGVQYLAKDMEGDLSSLSNEKAAVYHASEAGTKTGATHDGKYSWHVVKIQNARPLQEEESLSVDRQGFQLLSHTSVLKDFYNDDDLASIYNPEIEKLLLQEIHNAKKIIIFDHTRRSSSSEQRETLHCREPSSVIHNDYTDMSAKKRLRDILGESTASEILNNGRRFAIINVWRPIGGKRTTEEGNRHGGIDDKHDNDIDNDNNVVENWPLAFCDSTTVNVDEDLVNVKRIAKDRIGEIQMAYYNSNHRWYYFPRMKNFYEVIIFKTYDSIIQVNDTIQNRFTIHTSFDDPTCGNSNSEDGGGYIDPSPRQSVETRAFVLF